MNELIPSNEINMNHVELCELINMLRKEEGNEKELAQGDLIKKIRKEINTMVNLELNNSLGNFSESTYTNSRGKEYPTFIMNRDGILQIASSESTYVRAKIIEYINALENKLKEQQLQLNKKQQLQLAILNGDDITKVTALKEYETYLTQPLLDKIEEDKPKVTFADRVLKSKDNILVRQVAKIVSDEGFTIGEKKLYNKLREWGYICKNSTEPTQVGMDRKYFVVKLNSVNTPYGMLQTKTTLVTPKGCIHIVERLLKEVEKNN